MGKTTNILDLNNRLTKVERENVAQNSYTSLKNKPKINGVTLTGNKSLADIGAAAATDLTTLAGNVGDMSQLTTTDKSSTVAAINEVNDRVDSHSFSTEVEITGSSSYVCPSDGYIRANNNDSNTGMIQIQINGKNLINNYLDKMGMYETTSLFVKKGTVIDDMSTATNYKIFFFPLI